MIVWLDHSSGDLVKEEKGSGRGGVRVGVRVVGVVRDQVNVVTEESELKRTMGGGGSITAS